MFSPDALKALYAGTFPIWSYNLMTFGFTFERDLLPFRVGADVINKNQREVFPPDTEGPSSFWIAPNDPGVKDTCDEIPPTK